MYDLVIRNATIVDGTGREAYRGDLAVKDGAIVAVGEVSGEGHREIDATGQLLTPGWVDVHTTEWLPFVIAHHTLGWIFYG